MAKRQKINYKGYLDSLPDGSRIRQIWLNYYKLFKGTDNQKAYRFCSRFDLKYKAWCFTYPEQARDIIRIVHTDWINN